jgi:4-hydroxybenzoyl-CoA thioesterase
MTFEFAQKIRFSHCDPAGVLYFPHVFEFVNDTVEDWFEKGLGMPFNAFHMEHRFGNPVVRTDCEFLRPCRFGDELTLELAPTHIGRSSMEFRIVARVLGEERMRLRHRTAMISMDTFRSMAIPDTLRARAETFLAPAQDAPALRTASAPGITPPNAFARGSSSATPIAIRRIVYFARFFDMFDAALEDWFAAGLGAPWGNDFIGARNLHPSLAVACGFCRLPARRPIDFDLWRRASSAAR